MTRLDTFLINLRFFASSNKSHHTRSPYKYINNINISEYNTNMYTYTLTHKIKRFKIRKLSF